MASEELRGAALEIVSGKILAVGGAVLNLCALVLALTMDDVSAWATVVLAVCGLVALVAGLERRNRGNATINSIRRGLD